LFFFALRFHDDISHISDNITEISSVSFVLIVYSKRFDEIFFKRSVNFMDNCRATDNVCNFSHVIKIVLFDVKYRFSTSPV